MVVGESGIERVSARTCEVMNQLKTDDVQKIRAAGVVDVPTLQRYLNFHYSVTIDLFGADESSNAAIFYNVWPYHEATDDLDFLRDHGAELMLEIARFWGSIAHYNPERGRYEIWGVMGPHEFHET